MREINNAKKLSQKILLSRTNSTLPPYNNPLFALKVDDNLKNNLRKRSNHRELPFSSLWSRYLVFSKNRRVDPTIFQVREFSTWLHKEEGRRSVINCILKVARVTRERQNQVHREKVRTNETSRKKRAYAYLTLTTRSIHPRVARLH